MGKSFFNQTTRTWWGHVHLRIGGATQVRPNKGYRPTQFKHMGEALEFARMAAGLRPSTLGQYLGRRPRSKDPSAKAQSPAAYILSIESGITKPTKAEQEKLERLLGVPLWKPSKPPPIRRL